MGTELARPLGVAPPQYIRVFIHQDSPPVSECAHPLVIGLGFLVNTSILKLPRGLTMSHLVSLTSGMGETGLFMNNKDTPITQEIPKALGALCWEPKTRIIRVHTLFMSRLRKLDLNT